MRVLVCGGRHFADAALLNRTLDELHAQAQITEIIHGEARGADKLAGNWARIRMVPVKTFPANWRKHGNSAGPIRNRQMLREGRPDLVIAFPGGDGTADMMEQARAAHVEVREIR
jgi:hypothetical protein